MSLQRQRTTALVGESGSGKTTVARAAMGLIQPPRGRVSGEVLLHGRNLLTMNQRDLADVRGRDVAMIFQEPLRGLNPAYTVGDQIGEVVRRHLGCTRKDGQRRAVELLERVHVPGADRMARRYPFELSGGMCQRVMIAAAVACPPSVLIADEPTTALDVTVQAQVLDLLKELQDDLGLAMLFITHDLGVVADVADDVVVMYAGQVVETGTAEQVFGSPAHPYTEGLLHSIPDPTRPRSELGSIKGQVPKPSDWPTGCRFRGRCPYDADECADPVELRLVSEGAATRCVRRDELNLTGVPDV
jgi:oligopeptide/dipeptide ABC transporter ATP-binding protein